MLITFLTALSVSAMILLPIGLAIALRRRFAVPWWLFCFGIATLVASQLYHVPLNNWLADANLIGQVSAEAPRLSGTAIILGLSASLSETLARVAGYAVLFRRSRGISNGRRPGTQWQDAVMIGLGHGGVEAMVFGGIVTAASVSSLLALRGVDLTTLSLPPAQIDVLSTRLAQLTTSPGLVFVPLLERSIVILLQVVLSILVWNALRWRTPLSLVLAVIYHATVDATLVYVGQFIDNAWLLTGLLAVFVLPGTVWLWRTWPPKPTGDHRRVRGPADQMRLYGAAVRKELWQQWRTKRVLVAAAVFLLFGLGSPLIAHFTPQLMSSLEGAEQFAELIPEPSTVDAMDQYVRNITQFGFIIAILLGMGSVAGEMEKGTAAMILSKPLPRWAFPLSKFTAQAVIYSIGFTLSALGAYYYTGILFDGFAFWPFMLGNLLLLLWLLVYVAVTVLGSTVAQTTGAAAGIALVGSIALLLAGTLPRIGALAPSGLVAWSRQLGIEPAAVANGGAVAASAVIIMVCLVIAVAVFETREL